MMQRKHIYLSRTEPKHIKRMSASVALHSQFTNHPLFIVNRALRRQSRYEEENVEGAVIYDLRVGDQARPSDDDIADGVLPDAFDHAVLLYLLHTAQQQGSPRVELPSLAFALRELGIDPDHCRYRHRFVRALRKWHAASCRFYSLKKPAREWTGENIQVESFRFLRVCELWAYSGDHG